MAGYNEILVGRFARGLQKLTGIKGPAPTPTLSGDITATISLFEDGVENRYLQGWEFFEHATVVAAVAAVAGTVQIRNPAGSNIVAVFEKIVALSASAAVDSFALKTGAVGTDLTTPVALTTSRLDSRTRPTPTLVMSSQTNAAAFGQVAEVRGSPIGASADFILDFMHQHPLLPGDALQVTDQTVNTQLTVSFRWRERFLEEPERT